jgi:hypothetical protein
LAEGNPEGFSDRVNWLLRYKVFPECPKESNADIDGGGSIGYGDELPRTHPQRSSLIEEAPQCCFVCTTSTARSAEPGDTGIAIARPKHRPLAAQPAPLAANQRSFCHSDGEIGPRVGGCTTNSQPRRTLPDSFMRSGEQEGRKPQRATMGASQESYGESPGPRRKSPWSPTAKCKQGRQ